MDWPEAFMTVGIIFGFAAIVWASNRNWEINHRRHIAMLYDKRWDAKVKTADPLSLDGLIEWLEQQPANKTYDWMDLRGSCLLCQYVTARSIGSTWMRGYLDLTMKVPATEDVAFATPWTFGAALNRARALMPD